MPDPLASLLAAVAILGLLIGFFWPTHGLLSRWRKIQRMSTRVLSEDALKCLYKAEVEQRRPTLHSIAGTLQIGIDKATRLLADMDRRGLIVWQDDRPTLTPIGRDNALHIIRAHRLWEYRLAEHTGLDKTEWHALAERQEHELSRSAVSELSARLGHPTYDPHGDPIPLAEGHLERHDGKPLTSLELNRTARIVHIEDEPEVVYAQLIAEELSPGMDVHVLDKTRDRIIFWADGDEHILAPVLARNISVVALPESETPETYNTERLSNLKPGEKGKVLRISRFCHGAERRRLLDLGLTKGTIVEVELASAGGDPMAYLIRGALIALRSEQTRMIHISRLQYSQGHHDGK